MNELRRQTLSQKEIIALASSHEVFLSRPCILTMKTHYLASAFSLLFSERRRVLHPCGERIPHVCLSQLGLLAWRAPSILVFGFTIGGCQDEVVGAGQDVTAALTTVPLK